jgi:hypothetical protein
LGVVRRARPRAWANLVAAPEGTLRLDPLEGAVQRRAVGELAPDDRGGERRVVGLSGPLVAVHHDGHGGILR